MFNSSGKSKVEESLEIGLIIHVSLKEIGCGVKDYLKNGESLISYLRLKEAESMLNTHFKRIHKSFVINNREVDSYNIENEEISGRIIPIGKSYDGTIVDN